MAIEEIEETFETNPIAEKFLHCHEVDSLLACRVREGHETKVLPHRVKLAKDQAVCLHCNYVHKCSTSRFRCRVCNQYACTYCSQVPSAGHLDYNSKNCCKNLPTSYVMLGLISNAFWMLIKLILLLIVLSPVIFLVSISLFITGPLIVYILFGEVIRKRWIEDCDFPWVLTRMKLYLLLPFWWLVGYPVMKLNKLEHRNREDPISVKEWPILILGVGFSPLELFIDVYRLILRSS
mmetsp:Transcript_16490/g.18585  ORF Transcript_16490/g.18585 Transcript_16490/m.18585 type:complete len:236 (+) Transcript_16490:61-768(+)